MIGVVGNNFPNIAEIFISRLPSMLTAGVILEQVSVDSLYIPGCTRMENELPALFTSPYSFRGKCEKSDFYSAWFSHRLCAAPAGFGWGALRGTPDDIGNFLPETIRFF